jgi:hypothetical protein
LAAQDPRDRPGGDACLSSFTSQPASQQWLPGTAVADLDTERRNRHHQRLIDTLPAPMADHLHAWVRVLRGQGRRRHQAVGYALVPKQLWRDRVLHEANHTADPVHLIRLVGIHPSTAVKYVNAAHPDKALPRVR